MSYTFSRRDFMKYTALAAAAVAVSGSLTGCSNPNQPSTVFNGTADAKLSFGGSSNIFDAVAGNTDEHILKVDGTNYSNGTLTCAFSHKVIVESSCAANHYQLRIVDGNNTVQYVSAKSDWETSNGATINAKDKIDNTLTIPGLQDLINADVTSIKIQYFPRHNAVGNESDTYNDVYASWDITDFVKGKL